MWIVCDQGFFSAVRKSGDDYLTIRARAAHDLDALRDTHLPELGPTIHGGGTDYPARAICSHQAFGKALMSLVEDLSYSNFKSHIATVQGSERSHVYGSVWSALHGISDLEPSSIAQTPMSANDDGGGAVARFAADFPELASKALRIAYGGVVHDPDSGRILLREPTNHFDGYVWTFPKGSANADETPRQTALREVREETGIEAAIVAPLDQWFAGGTTQNAYYVMHAVADHGCFDAETSAIRWVSLEDARQLISQSTNAVGRRRDLAILAAFEKFAQPSP